MFASDKKSKKVAATSEGEIGKGEMRFWAVGYRSYELFGPRSSGLPSASVFSGLQTEQFLLFIIVTRETFHDSCIFGATTDLGRWRFLLDDDNIN